MGRVVPPGTGIVIVSRDNYAIVLTAKHVLERVQDFSVYFPVDVITKMLGVPAEFRQQVRRWIDGWVEGLLHPMAGVRILDVVALVRFEPLLLELALRHWPIPLRARLPARWRPSNPMRR